MESVAQAVAILRSGSTVECARALAYARDVAPHDATLWQAAIEYFAEKAPPELWGYFGVWLSRTMAAGQPAEVAVRRLLSSIRPLERNERLLAQLAELMGETSFRNLGDWTASQPELWLELVRGWNEQPACSEAYACSHNLILGLARCVVRKLEMPQQTRLSEACLEALLKHRLAPAHACLSGLPDAMERALSPASIPVLLNFLELGAVGLEPPQLRQFTKKKAANPTNVPAIRLCFHGLLTLVAHPDWDLRAASRPLAVPRKVMSALIDLLYHSPQRTLQRLPGETSAVYVERLPPLAQILELCQGS